MSIGDLIGVVIATYELFTAAEVLPALFWLVLAFAFLVRFDRSLGWLGDIDDYLYDYFEEENEPWEEQEQQSQHGNRRS